MIEAAVAAARDVRVDGVEDLPVFFVGVEALIDEVAKVAASLRDAESQSAFDRGHVVTLVFEIRRQVARRRKAQPHDRRVLRAINDLINLARLETAFEMDGCRIGNGLPIDKTRETPLSARNHTPLAQHGVAHRQLILCAVRLDRGLRLLAAMPERGVEDL